MNSENIPFQTIDWGSVESIEQSGETGTVSSKTIQYPGLRIRLIEYSSNYSADHWCHKGHIVHCLEGSFTTHSENGESVHLTKGMSYVVSDDLSSHRSVSATGVKLMIIDGDFLKLRQ
ncbi:MAG: DHCW motif cupin fold protein [Cyclobacteriaceae bacterium]|nr:DHCW motif cupin fold protein [Cyclobacteriaceae bacterium]